MDRVSLPFYRWSLTASRPKPRYPKQLNTLGDHLKARRLDLGVTQWAIAERLGVDPDTVRNWEAGRTSVEVRYYPAVISFLGYNPLPGPATRGEAVRHERLIQGLSRKRLALLAGVDESTVKRLEADTRGMAVESWKRVSAVLKMVRE